MENLIKNGMIWGENPLFLGFNSTYRGYIISPLIISASGPTGPTGPTLKRGRNRSELSTTEPSHGMILQVLIGSEGFLLKSETQDDVRVVKKRYFLPLFKEYFTYQVFFDQSINSNLQASS